MSKNERLGVAILQTIDEFSEVEQLTTGDVMRTLFGLLVTSAQESPQYDPKALVAEMDAMIREAVGLQ